MRISNDFLGDLLRPAAAKPKPTPKPSGPTSRERAAAIALANVVAHEVLGRTLDELPPQTRKLLTLLSEWVRAQCGALHVQQADFRFTRRELREAVHWGDTQLKVHLVRLVEMEFLAVHRRGLTHAYELVYDGRDGNGEGGGAGQRAHLCGLREVDGLTDAHHYDGERSGFEAARSASGRGMVGARSATGRGASNPAQTQTPRGLQADAVGLNGHEDRQALFRQERAPLVLPSAIPSAA